MMRRAGSEHVYFSRGYPLHRRLLSALTGAETNPDEEDKADADGGLVWNAHVLRGMAGLGGAWGIKCISGFCASRTVSSGEGGWMMTMMVMMMVMTMMRMMMVMVMTRMMMMMMMMMMVVVVIMMVIMMMSLVQWQARSR
jgi:hypothetical protein